MGRTDPGLGKGGCLPGVGVQGGDIWVFEAGVGSASWGLQCEGETGLVGHLWHTGPVWGRLLRLGWDSGPWMPCEK